MAIYLICPSCSAIFAVAEKYAGKKSNCGKCGNAVEIPQLPPPESGAPFDSAPNETSEGEQLLDNRQFKNESIGFEYESQTQKSHRWSPTLIAIAAGIVLLSATSIALIFVRGCASSRIGMPGVTSATKDSDLLIWAPADSDTIVSADMGEIGMLPDINEPLNRAEIKRRRTGLWLDGIERMIIAGSGKLTESESVTICRVRRTFDPRPFTESTMCKVRNHNGYSYIQLPYPPRWMFYPEPKVVVITDNEQLIHQAIDAKAAPPAISPGLVKSHQEAAGFFTVAAIGTAANKGPVANQLALLFEKNPDPPPPCVSQGVSTKFQNGYTKVRIECKYADAVQADLAAMRIESAMKKATAPAPGNLMDDDQRFLLAITKTFKVQASGESVVIMFNLPNSEVGRLKVFGR